MVHWFSVPLWLSLSVLRIYTMDHMTINHKISNGRVVTTITLSHKQTCSGYASPIKRIHNIPSSSSNNQLNPNQLNPIINNNAVSNSKCGISTLVRPLIVNGRKATPGNFPWLAAMYFRQNKQFICGGNLISEKHILTAAHCFRDSDIPGNYLIYLGLHELTALNQPGVKWSFGQQLRIHADYKKGISDADADIAMLTIDKIEFSSRIRAICFPSEHLNIADLFGQKGIIAGWGTDENGIMVTPEIREVSVSIVPTNTCQNKHAEFRRHVTERTFCAGGALAGPCYGDSGGGIFIYREGRWHLRGIISQSIADNFLRSGCDTTNYAIYVDIGKFTDWIKQSLA